jgi:hypothetical protein
VSISITSVGGDVLYVSDSPGGIREALMEARKASADLHGADLYGADLYGANLRGADLYGADLHGAKSAELAIAQTRIIPDGDIIGWKVCRDKHLVKLLIPADAQRSHAAGRKCRSESALVLAIYDGDDETDTAASKHDETFIYLVGETVTPTESFDTDMWNECASGIHWWITREEAESWL